MTKPKEKPKEPVIERTPHIFFSELCGTVIIANLSKKEYALRIRSLVMYHTTHGYTRRADKTIRCPICTDEAKEQTVPALGGSARLISIASDYFGKPGEEKNRFELKKDAGLRVFVCEKCGAAAITELTDVEYGMRFDTHGRPDRPYQHNLECPICMGSMWNTHSREGTSRNLEAVFTPMVMANLQAGAKKK